MPTPSLNRACDVFGVKDSLSMPSAIAGIAAGLGTASKTNRATSSALLPLWADLALSHGVPRCSLGYADNKYVRVMPDVVIRVVEERRLWVHAILNSNVPCVTSNTIG